MYPSPHDNRVLSSEALEAICISTWWSVATMALPFPYQLYQLHYPLIPGLTDTTTAQGAFGKPQEIIPKSTGAKPLFPYHHTAEQKGCVRGWDKFKFSDLQQIHIWGFSTFSPDEVETITAKRSSSQVAAGSRVPGCNSLDKGPVLLRADAFVVELTNRSYLLSRQQKQTLILRFFLMPSTLILLET